MPSFLPARFPLAASATTVRPGARAAVLTAMVAVPTLALAIAVGPALGADAATATPAVSPTTSHYSLSVHGDGTKALVFWSTARQGGATAGTTSGTPVTKLPWHHSVSAKADLYQVVAIQQKGTRLSCTIRNSAGKVVSSAYSLGRSAVVTCTLSKRDLFSLSSLG